MDDRTDVIETIRSAVVGNDDVVAGPVGPRRLTFADYNASGRSRSFIEDFISEAVLPLYASTHAESSGTSLQTSRFPKKSGISSARSSALPTITW